MLPFFSLILTAITLFTQLSFVRAQDAPLWVQGSFEDASVADETFNSGGSITVNGFTMNVPKNVLVQFPAAWVPWRDFVASKADFAGFETLVSLSCFLKKKRNLTPQTFEVLICIKTR